MSAMEYNTGVDNARSGMVASSSNPDYLRGYSYGAGYRRSYFGKTVPSIVTDATEYQRGVSVGQDDREFEDELEFNY